MKVAEVSKDDCKMLAQLINMLQMAEFTTTGKDMCAGADSLRWLQAFAVDCAKVFQSESSAMKPSDQPPSTPDEGGSPLKIKAFSPGKAAKK
jgi:EAL domain-containing protein (putative c-di-GMP-specific phosphodiesterase class I)